jgi:transposase-like protein
MSRERRTFTADFKAQVGLEALRGIDTVHAIAQKHGVHPVQVSQWKKEVLERLPEVFAKKKDKVAEDHATREAELFRKIGQLEMELDWLKKKSAQISRLSSQ